MAKKNKQKKSPYQCGDKSGGKSPCYKVEQVQQGKKKGYVTVFVFPSIKKEAWSSSGEKKISCRMTPDPFRATLRKAKVEADRIGRRCIMSIAIAAKQHAAAEKLL